MAVVGSPKHPLSGPGSMRTAALRTDATNYKFNPQMPLRVYLKICVDMLNRAQDEFQAGNVNAAYMYYFRYVDLVTNKLARHPHCMAGASQVGHETYIHRQEYLQLVKLELPCVMRIVEDLQRKIDVAHEKSQLSLAKNIAKTKQHAQAQGTFKLPSNFNENKFNQSLSFLNNSAIETITPKQEAKVGSNSASNSKTASATADDKALIYPELPQLNTASY
ncbi:hypothetical protein TPHA_0P00160 [Tetrapisispora phaffii CBS 4417]|uniref:Regulator of free ubiquitin chains 1 n=1 Tax=Tetrapisispora phaffii (strain ATCC 24235 / CBS 4417 / NBRC 1672 / NRRL Y-8282 / UCD 70-5) TaxID=1071381 RepID=G8C1Z6_TETPH|nr:hypothetical protein TPHA_0P00160 [Tetrapisispora phaffii CBS 4417]CCE66174.1 hypothetical protein TPHA_0P00160 [Tetrapisispora phaffii CBS 4417]